MKGRLYRLIEEKLKQEGAVVSAELAEYLINNSVLAPLLGVGDMVYYIPGAATYRLNLIENKLEGNRVYKTKIREIQIYQEGRYAFITWAFLNLHSDFYGETWFTTEAEAEAALKELERKYKK